MTRTFDISGLVFLIVAVMGLGVMVALAAHFYSASRRGALNAAVVTPLIPAQAAERGWGYIAHAPERAKYFTAYPFFPHFYMRVHDVVWGTVDGRPFETFALSLPENTFASAGDGKNSSEATDFQVVWIGLKAPLPRVQFTRDGSAWRKMAQLGSARVDVESGAFNRLWEAYSSDARVCHAILGPRLIERLMAPDARVLDYTFEGSALMTSVPYLTDLAPIEAMVRTLYAVADLVPPFLFEPHEGA